MYIFIQLFVKFILFYRSTLYLKELFDILSFFPGIYYDIIIVFFISKYYCFIKFLFFQFHCDKRERERGNEPLYVVCHNNIYLNTFLLVIT